MRVVSIGNTYPVYSTSRYGQNSMYGKIAGGKRINRASDDAAGLAIAQKILKENKGLDAGASNIRDGIGVANVQMIFCTDTNGRITPMRFRFRDRNDEIITVEIDSVCKGSKVFSNLTSRFLYQVGVNVQTDCEICLTISK